MNIFLSWSGSSSREVAVALHNWLPLVIQAARPFVSTGDVEKGQRWNDALANELNAAAYGIICVTRFNLNKAWMNFEAGAISKALGPTSVSPFLFGLDPTRLEGPLSQFQATVREKDDVLRLVHSINHKQEPDDRVSEDVLKREFDQWWPQLDSALEAIAHTPPAEYASYPWLFTRNDLDRFAADAACKDIWVVTPHPYGHSLDDRIRDTMRRNLQRGVTYTFITPPSDNVDVVRNGLRLLSNPEQVRIQVIEQAAFSKLAATDYVIVNPGDRDLHAFLQLPIKDPGYWIEVDGEAALNFVARFRDLAERGGPRATPTPAKTGSP